MEKEELKRLEQKINFLEKELYLVKRQLIQVKNEYESPVIQKAEVYTEPEKPIPAESSADPIVEKEPFDFSVERWLPKVFLFVLLIGSIWGFMAASQNGWVSPGLRVLTGGAISIVMYALGERFSRDQRKLSITLLSGSIVLAIITLFSANILYGYIGGLTTNLLLILLISVGLWASHKHGSQLILCLIGAGAYLFPFIFAGDERNEWLFYGYELVLFFVLMTFSTWKRYRIAWNIHYYLLYFSLFFFAAFGVGEITLTVLIPFAIQHAYILLLIVLNRDERVNAEMIPALVTGSFILLGLLNDVYTAIPISYYVIFAVVYLGASFIEPKEMKRTKDTLLVLGFLHMLLFLFDLFEYDWRFVLIAIEANVLLWLAGRRESYVSLAGSFLLMLLSFLGMVTGSQADFIAIELPIFILAFAYVYLFSYFNQQESSFMNVSVTTMKVVLTGLVMFFILRLTEFIVIGWDYTPRTTAYTVAIAALSIGYLIYGESRKDMFYRWVGIIFLALALLKFFLADLVFLDFTIRAMILIPIGVIGLVLSRILYKKE
ncbi:DUF2339 domain-containing protein [Rossellomorea vietnamensis]|uniref:DUF2339 domain-containing protein n=1 Tax=Rossellomorea vietnamensis TaxID=218284 RepID=UPI00077C39F2|nr:DUF2339 domain-containing protein [Rossellomorea vietnamensis]OXS64337.1 hypothetical protein B1B00_01035 [Bacillus sp. DSM 27956]PRX79472.1 putative membrane protein DUF2339 [Bacillus sp. V-88]SLJ95456.1 Predicted membrane protein [Bacillus sp. V-88]